MRRNYHKFLLPNRSDINVKTLMLLQLHEIENSVENNVRFIVLMAPTSLLHLSSMKKIINNFNILKGGEGHDIIQI